MGVGVGGVVLAAHGLIYGFLWMLLFAWLLFIFSFPCLVGRLKRPHGNSGVIKGCHWWNQAIALVVVGTDRKRERSTTDSRVGQSAAMRRRARVKFRPSTYERAVVAIFCDTESKRREKRRGRRGNGNERELQ